MLFAIVTTITQEFCKILSHLLSFSLRFLFSKHALKLIRLGLVLVVCNHRVNSLSVEDAQSYSLLAKPVLESQPSYLIDRNKNLFSQSESRSMPITPSANQYLQPEDPLLQNGNLQLIKDTQMQINPNGVALKLQY